MTAQDYPISFAYGAWDGEYYTATRPHKGNDRATPTRTPVVVEGVTIGLTGNTGMTSGPHLHIQAGYDEWAQVAIRPDAHEFKRGTVVKTGAASQWGNYVCVRTDEGVNVFYCHLSEIHATVGQVITGEETMTPESLNILAQVAWNTPGDKKFYDAYTGKEVKATLLDVLNSKANVELRTKAANYDALKAAYDGAGTASEKLEQIKEILNQEK